MGKVTACGCRTRGFRRYVPSQAASIGTGRRWDDMSASPAGLNSNGSVRGGVGSGVALSVRSAPSSS